MKTPTGTTPRSIPDQDSTINKGETSEPKSFSREKSKLSDFAKAVIRECAEQPRNTIYKTYAQVLKYCPASGYTISQVGRYLRYVRKGIVSSKLSPPLNNHTTNLPYVPTYLPKTTTTLTKNAPTTTKRQELVNGGFF